MATAGLGFPEVPGTCSHLLWHLLCSLLSPALGPRSAPSRPGFQRTGPRS